MTNLTTSQYKHLNGQLLIESINSGSSSYYLFVGDHVPHSNVTLQPIIDDTQNLSVTAWNNMIFGKRIANTDIKALTRNVEWTANTVYTAYDDDVDLTTEDFFAISSEGSFYHFWKCLDNNNGANSTVQPLFSDISGANTNLYQTSDGYRWKYMTTVDNATALKFKTTDYFPIEANTTVESNATKGSIDIIRVESQGKKYNNYIDGIFSTSDIKINGDSTLYAISNGAVVTTNGYYNDCVVYITSGVASGEYSVIDSYVSNSIGSIAQLTAGFDIVPESGDQYQIRPQVIVTSDDDQQTINCIARALVNSQNSNSIYRTEVLVRGANYRNANAYVSVDPVVGVSNVAAVRPILPTAFGHGANCFSELYSKDVSISITLSNTESSTIPATNDYQQYGIIKDPKFSNVVFTVTGQNNDFIAEEIIYKITPVRVQANVTVASDNTYIVCNSALFLNQFTAGDRVFITSNDVGYSQLVTIDNVANNIAIQLTANSLFSCTESWVYIPNISSNAICNVVTNATSIQVNSSLGIFRTGDQLVGKTSGTTALISNITRNSVVKSFNTFIQSYKYIITVTNGTFIEDEIVGCLSEPGMTGYVHSYSGSGTITMFVTNFTGGRFIVGHQIFGQTSQAIGVITSAFEQELEHNSGNILYLENVEPITRQSNQTESINVIFNF